MESISYALGILFAKNLQDQGLNEISTDDMAKGLAEQMAASASMTPEQANAMVGEFFLPRKKLPSSSQGKRVSLPRRGQRTKTSM